MRSIALHIPPPAFMTAVDLIVDAHGALLRGISECSGQHYQGLSQAARHFSRTLTSKQKRYLCNLDTAFNVLRHVTRPKITQEHATIMHMVRASSTSSTSSQLDESCTDESARVPDSSGSLTDSPYEHFDISSEHGESIAAEVASHAHDLYPARHVDLSLVEEDLLANGNHVLVSCIMKPNAGDDFLATAAHFAAGSSAGTNVNLDAFIFCIEPSSEDMNIAFPNILFDSNIIDGHALMNSVHTFTIGNKQGLDHVEYVKLLDIYFPPTFVRLFDGPDTNILDLWRSLGCSTTNAGQVVGSIIKPYLRLQPTSYGAACLALWQGGEITKCYTGLLDNAGMPLANFQGLDYLLEMMKATP